MSESDVRRLLATYLDGSLTLRALDEALGGAIWNMDAAEDARALANTIALRLDEYSSGACDEQTLRAALSPLVTNYAISVTLGTGSSVQIQTGASARLVQSSVTATPSITAIPIAVGR